MKKKATILIASIMAFCEINTAHADEGMWTIYNLHNAVYEMMQREGFSMTYDQLYNGENALKNAVVNFSCYYLFLFSIFIMMLFILFLVPFFPSLCQLCHPILLAWMSWGVWVFHLQGSFG